MNATVLLLPGQGAQSAGMGRDLTDRYASARALFREASAATGLNLEEICFEDPNGELSRTDLCQPAIMTVSVAALKAIAEEMGGGAPRVSAAAGLSLGEYSALVAAEAMDFADAVRLVYHRGRYMQEACELNPGAMYSIIGLEDAQVEDACRKVREQEGGRVWPANYNNPGQLVISGEREAAARAAALCAEMGARRAVQLKVTGAFHTPLMQPAADKLARELEHVAIREPAFPVIANTTAQPLAGPQQIRRQLARQVTNPVLWSLSMQWCISRGLEEFLEPGPGRVLKGILKRIDPSRKCVTVNGAEDVRALGAER